MVKIAPALQAAVYIFTRVSTRIEFTTDKRLVDKSLFSIEFIKEQHGNISHLSSISWFLRCPRCLADVTSHSRDCLLLVNVFSDYTLPLVSLGDLAMTDRKRKRGQPLNVPSKHSHNFVVSPQFVLAVMWDLECDNNSQQVLF